MCVTSGHCCKKKRKSDFIKEYSEVKATLGLLLDGKECWTFIMDQNNVSLRSFEREQNDNYC